jgi:O-antigen/teichoic acid export membrane protein
MKTAISYAASRNADASFLDAVRTKMRWGILTAAGCLVVAAYYYFNHNLTLAYAFAVAVPFLPLLDTYGNYVAYLQGKKRFDVIVLSELAIQAINATALVACMVFAPSLFWLLLAYLASLLVTRYYFFRRSLKVAPPNDVRDPATISYGKHLSVMSIMGVFASNIDKFLLWHFLGPAEVAIYTFALAIPLRATNALSSINRIYFPKAAERPLAAMRTSLPRNIFLVTLGAIVIALAYALVAPYIFAIFFPAYQEAVIYTQLAAALIAFQPLSLINTVLGAHARKKALYVSTIVPAVAQIGLFFLLIPLLDIQGALIALILTQVVEGVVLLVLFWKNSRPTLVS